MDACEATNTVMSRIQTLVTDNVSKIMGYILIQDHGDEEMIRLAFSPDPILLSYINRAKASFAPPSPPLFSHAHFPQNPPRILLPTNNGGGGFRLPADEYRLSNPGGLGLGLGPTMSPGGRSDSSPGPNPFHKRSYSVNDAGFLSNLEEGDCGLWRPCMNLKRGFSCNGDPIEVGSPGEDVSGFDELMGMKALLQQQKRVWAMKAHNPFAYNRGDVSPLGLTASAESAESVARQIYLTFPSDSTFREEDVSDYFGTFGPVHDVRIPYQQKRMFGFVTFVYPETVKRILAKGNPHFVCDSRVLVKPYKEKGKVKEKKHSPRCLSPSRVDVHSDTRFGPRMMFSQRGMTLRRKFKQESETQRAIEFEGQRMMNLHLMDHKYHKYRYINRQFTSSSDSINQENSEEFDASQNSTVEEAVIDDESKLHHENSDEFGVHERFSSGREAIEL